MLDAFKDGDALLVASRCLNPKNWTGKIPELSDDHSTGLKCLFPSHGSQCSTSNTKQDGNDDKHESNDHEHDGERNKASAYESEANETHTEEYESCDSTESSLDETDLGCCSELPLDSRVLHNIWAKNNLALPFFVAADSKAIIHLMTSTLYQWYVWCIHAPLVGVEICSDSPLVRIHIGWLENIEGSPVCISQQDMNILPCLIMYQPIAHIARPSVQTSPSYAVGSYDLRSTQAAHALSDMILHLRGQVECVVAAINTPRLRRFCWRLDHLSFGQNKDDDEHSLISSWLQTSSSSNDNV